MNEAASASTSSIPLRESAQPAPPVADYVPSYQEEPSTVDFGDDEEAMLAYALNLSRQLSEPTDDGRQTPEIRLSFDQTPNHNSEGQMRTLPPSAQRLLTLIDEALNVPTTSYPEETISSSSSSESEVSENYHHSGNDFTRDYNDEASYHSFRSNSSDAY